jgi:hypothetical protein
VVEQIETTTKRTSKRKKLGAVSFRPFEDDYLYLEKLSKENGLAIRTMCRDLISEAVRARKQPPVSYEEIDHGLKTLLENVSVMSHRQQEFLKRYDQNEERETRLSQILITQLRRLGGVLAEVLEAAILAKRLIWKYVASEVLKTSKYSESRISELWQAEVKTAGAESKERLRQVDQFLASEENGQPAIIAKR